MEYKKGELIMTYITNKETMEKDKEITESEIKEAIKEKEKEI